MVPPKMDPERWRRIEKIYHEAASHPTSERHAFLAAACGPDATLLDEVQSLLDQGASETGSFDRGPVLASMTEPRLRAGERLGAYEVRGLLGVGGMGEVYRAYDGRLGRDVALKLLPQAFTSDSQRLARFEREARVLASLNHPNIGAIYGIEETSRVPGVRGRALVLEFVEGPTLADRIARGPLTTATATKIAIQIAQALEAAHDKGIVHRDLKPANVKITPAGMVKVLDFGLATPVEAPSSGSNDVATFSGERTQPGVIVGTLSYMSPEQARGIPVDRRTDVWAFGCVLFEMLTGKPAFPGETMSDTIAKILEREPDWSMLPPATPGALRRVLRWALAKDPQRRLRHLGDACLELESADPNASARDAERPRTGWPLAAALVTAVIGGIVVGAFGARRWTSQVPDSARQTANFAIPVAVAEVWPRNVAISPDARYVAYVAGPPGNQKTYLRHVGDRQSRLIAQLPMQSPQPFFSPDSQWVAYFDAGKLKKVSVSGDAPVTLAEAPTPRGGTWGTDGSIVFAPISRGGLVWLPPTGGRPQVLTTPDAARGETSHRGPTFLPESRTVVFVAESSTGSARSLQVVSLDSKQVAVLTEGGGVFPRYVPTGHLAYLLDEKVVVVPFDAAALRITGPPATAVADTDSFSFSADGTLVYTQAVRSNVLASTMVWVDRNGSVSRLPLAADNYEHPRLSPDGRTIVVQKATGADSSLWIYDLTRETLSKFTLAVRSDWPVWGADSRSIIYASNRPGTQWDIFVKPADGSGAERVVLARPLTQIPRAAAPTGDVLIFEETYADRPNTLWRMSLRDGEPQPLFETANGEMMPTFSPDGRWVGYVSPRSGRNEVYVTSSNGTGRMWQISSDGGAEPIWSFSGGELFYRANDKMMVVDVTRSETLSFSKPRVLFEGDYMFGTTEGQQFDVTRDGRRFLMLKAQQPLAATPLNVRVNWFDEVRRQIQIP